MVTSSTTTAPITTTRVVFGAKLDFVGKKLPGKPENFTRDQAEAIRAVLRTLRDKYDNQTLLGEEIGVSQQNISRLCAPPSTKTVVADHKPAEKPMRKRA